MIKNKLSEKIPVRFKDGTLTEVLHVILRKTLLKKGSPSNSLPKTFEFKFCP